MGRLAPPLPGNDALQLPAKPVDALRVQRRQALCHRQQQRLLGIFGAPLRRGVKKAHRVQLIAKKFAPHRHRLARRVHVENAAAQRKLTDAFYQRRSGIARLRETLNQIFRGEACADTKKNTCRKQHRARHRPKRHCTESCNQQRQLSCRQIVKKLQPFLLPLARHAGCFDECQLALRQNRNLHAEKALQLFLQPACRQLVLHQKDRGAGRFCVQRSKKMAARNLAQPGHCRDRAARDGVQQLLILRALFQRLQQNVHACQLLSKIAKHGNYVRDGLPSWQKPWG